MTQSGEGVSPNGTTGIPREVSQSVGTDGLLDRRSYHSDAVTSAYYEDIERWLDAIEEHGGAVGIGVLAHATASDNRASIAQWGLDWRRMGGSPGIVGSGSPELEAVFLDHIERVDFFTAMSRCPCDVWEVDAVGLWIEVHEGWLIHRAAIPPSRLRLIAQDVPTGSGDWRSRAK